MFAFDAAARTLTTQSSNLAHVASSPFNLRIHAKYSSDVHAYSVAGILNF